ncbi:hypothetical protein [Providencia manganoxydans]|uniref:hypothetical protein n=1 Tax=Providencia manganoxydans TaxID=2923283 RepID=UPI0029BFBF1D|nr:hypothetical protein [Providencia manganoxydans]MDX4947179.1 hypothetical protein [Providencia manganoxydans]
MRMTASERKAKQRERQKQQGLVKVELLLDEQEMEMLTRNCALRRPGRDPYDESEYIQMLIRNDDARLKREIAELSNRCCGKCGERLPVTECCLDGGSECWITKGWHELKLIII